jgi:membrane protein DedA with SNARE-associated domain
LCAPRAGPGWCGVGGGGTLLHSIEQALLDFIGNTYDAIGWPGVIFLMALETVVFPIPSEIVMPLAGWQLIADEGHGWPWIILAGIFGATGSTIGAIGIYYIAKLGGQPFIRRYGKYVLISQDEIASAERFFDKYGTWAIFFGRMVPLVRSLVSVPAGLVNMPIVRFTVYTFLGSFVWAVGLTYGGYKLGENYEDIRDWMSPVEYPIAAILLIAGGWYVYRQIKKVWFEERSGLADET